MQQFLEVFNVCKNLGKGGFFPPFCPQSSPEPNRVKNKAQAQNNIKADPGRLPAGSQGPGTRRLSWWHNNGGTEAFLTSCSFTFFGYLSQFF